VDLAEARLANQQLVRPRFTTAAELVAWFGAVQAQDYAGSLWAIGQRLPDALEVDVEAAVASRAIIRTWPMRETLHFVAAPDVRWMLALLAPRLPRRNAGRHRHLELDAAVFAQARKLLARALRGGVRLTRAAAYQALEHGGISPGAQRGIHVLGYLAQEGLICFGPRDGKQLTFVLFEDWVPPCAVPSREEALARMATLYFRSHGPATLLDFAWWSGLPMKDARAAIHEAGDAIESDTRASPVTWTGKAAGARAGSRPRRRPLAALLPPWDEYLVAYKDRQAALGHLTMDPPPMVIGNALVIVDGRVRGTWKRRLAPSGVAITLDFWSRPSESEKRATLAAVERYGRFVGRKAVGSFRTGARTPP
jgi:hypothetical protein